jgi:hypothetical protein
MARARLIKPHFMFSRSMHAVSRMARLTFIQLWLVADDAGRVLAHPPAGASRNLPAGFGRDSRVVRERKRNAAL